MKRERERESERGGGLSTRRVGNEPFISQDVNTGHCAENFIQMAGRERLTLMSRGRGGRRWEIRGRRCTELDAAVSEEQFPAGCLGLVLLIYEIHEPFAYLARHCS